QLSRRGPLGAETGQQSALAQGSVRLAGEVRTAGRTLGITRSSGRGAASPARLNGVQGISPGKQFHNSFLLLKLLSERAWLPPEHRDACRKLGTSGLSRPAF